MSGFWKSGARALVDVLSPPVCVLCGLEASDPVCANCADVCPTLTTACPRCALPLPHDHARCGACRLAPPVWRFAAAAQRYTFPVDVVLQRFKYHGDRALAPALSALLQPLAALPWLVGAELVPLPLHRRRERRRGFNQAQVLARSLAVGSGRPLRQHWLSRCVDTPAQVGLSAAARRRNLVGAFVATPEVAGRHIVLVDDVMTTGATLTAATQALFTHGARQVDCVVLARAVSAAQAGA
ncbi:MAG: phosphoribosyltransferase family protein [Pseudomonadota bacterium]